MKKYLVIFLISSIIFSCGSTKKVVESTTPGTTTTPKTSKGKRPSSKRDEKKVVVAEKAVDKNKEWIDYTVGQIKSSSKSNLRTTTVDYVKKYALTAMSEMKKFKIPASVTMAQGILESGSGLSELSLKSNNHFGIKCHKGWKGKKVYHDDDAKGECFRKYNNPATSFQDHSLFLTSRYRYASLFKLDIDDYKKWAKGLKKAGYATDPKYPNKLITLIEDYQLYRFDEAVLNGKKIKLDDASYDEKEEVKKPVIVEEKIEDEPQKVLYNERGYYIVQKDDTLYYIAQLHGLTVNKVKRLNRLRSNNIEIGQALNVQNKLFDYNKPKPTPKRVAKPVVKKAVEFVATANKSQLHTVQKKETLFAISRLYGISVRKLKALNGLKNNSIGVGQQLIVGDVVAVSQVPDKILTPKVAVTKVVEEKVPEEIKIVQKAESSVSKVTSSTIKPEAVSIEKVVEEKAPEEIKVTSEVVQTVSQVVETEKPVVAVPENKVVTEKGTEEVHTVKTKENLYSIAKYYGTTVEAIQTLNGLTTLSVEIGDQLWIKNNSGAAVDGVIHPVAVVQNTDVHIVAPKQTLYAISRLYGVSVQKLKALNGLTSNELTIGQELKVK